MSDINKNVNECKAKLEDALTNTDNSMIDELIVYFNEGASWNEFVLDKKDRELLIKCLELLKSLKTVGKIEVNI